MNGDISTLDVFEASLTCSPLGVLNSPSRAHGGLRETAPLPQSQLFSVHTQRLMHGSDLLAKLEMASEFPTGMFSSQTELCFKPPRVTGISAKVME